MAEELVMAVRSGPGIGPIAEKLEPAHITKLLESEEREQTLSHDRKMVRLAQRVVLANRLTCLAAAAVVALTVVCCLLIYTQQTSYLATIITALASGAGGYGVGRAQERGERTSPK